MIGLRIVFVRVFLFVLHVSYVWNLLSFLDVFVGDIDNI